MSIEPVDIKQKKIDIINIFSANKFNKLDKVDICFEYQNYLKLMQVKMKI